MATSIIDPSIAKQIAAKFQAGLGAFNSGNMREAKAYYSEILETEPKNISALKMLGIIEANLHDYKKSIHIFSKIIDDNCADYTTYLNRGSSYANLRYWDLARNDFIKAYELNENSEWLLGMLQHINKIICDWSNSINLLEITKNKLDKMERVIMPFFCSALMDSCSYQYKAASIWTKFKFPVKNDFKKNIKYNHKKIKIAYISCDFREHPVSYLTVNLFECHDRSKFEIVAISYSPSTGEPMQQRVINAFDSYVDVSHKSDHDVAQLMRDMEIDIAVDLSGHTHNSRTGIFSYRAAPLQLSYIGYLGTMGAEYYDYLIADYLIIPAESRQFYSEKIVYLPSYQVNDPKREISTKEYNRAELNLPEKGFVFCCFNSSYKISMATFDGWMRILSAVHNSVLFLFAENKISENNLKAEANKRGVDSSRLIFASRINRSEYLARYRVADLFLDTLPYNAGTTASDALWAGLPVLTCMGESFASRVAASILTSIEMPELITSSQEQFEAMAIDLATNSLKLNLIKEKLEHNKLTTALFDTSRFTRHLESAYIQMYDCHQSGMPPDHIYI